MRERRGKAIPPLSLTHTHLLPLQRDASTPRQCLKDLKQQGEQREVDVSYKCIHPFIRRGQQHLKTW